MRFFGIIEASARYGPKKRLREYHSTLFLFIYVLMPLVGDAVEKARNFNSSSLHFGDPEFDDSRNLFIYFGVLLFVSNHVSCLDTNKHLIIDGRGSYC